MIMVSETVDSTENLELVFLPYQKTGQKLFVNGNHHPKYGCNVKTYLKHQSVNNL
jgi:hypothetical protein